MPSKFAELVIVAGSAVVLMVCGALKLTSLVLVPNGTNLTSFWDFRELLAPADSGDGFQD
jgi:hypothetical protein